VQFTRALVKNQIGTAKIHEERHFDFARTKMRRSSDMKVSIVTPTHGRPHHLMPLYRIFKGQTHEDKELLVFDDSPVPSRELSAMSDPSVRYFHCPQRLSIGEKRDRLVREARGDVIVHFDDDDYYAPEYVTFMIEQLSSCDFVTLSSWFVYDTSSARLYFWNTQQAETPRFRVHPKEGMRLVPPPGNKEAWIRKTSWGFGFSYVFRKSVYASVQFDRSRAKGEDYDFVDRLMARRFVARAAPDEIGLVLHVIHRGNTSCVYPNVALPGFLLRRVLGQGAVDYLESVGAAAEAH
jgi:glycosyltransferase involved in cell wall biosynthesis